MSLVTLTRQHDTDVCCVAAAVFFLTELFKFSLEFITLPHISILCNHICLVSPVCDCVVRLQPSLPAERADPDLREPKLLQEPHSQSHHAGSPHVLLGQHLLRHLLPAGRWPYFFLQLFKDATFNI